MPLMLKDLGYDVEDTCVGGVEVGAERRFIQEEGALGVYT